MTNDNNEVIGATVEVPETGTVVVEETSNQIVIPPVEEDETSKLQPRSSTPTQYLWDLSELLQGMTFAEGKQFVRDAIEKIKTFAGELSNPEKAKAFMEYFLEVLPKATRILYFGVCNFYSEMTNEKFEQESNEVDQLDSEFNQAYAFVEPEFLSLPKEQLEEYKNSQWVPDCEKYFADIIRKKEHTLGSEGEKVSAAYSLLAGKLSGQQSMAISKYIKWPKVKLSDGREITLNPGEYAKARTEKNPADRELVFETFLKTLKENELTFTYCLHAKKTMQLIDVQQHKHERIIDASLFDRELPNNFLDTLMENTKALLPALAKYLKFKASVLGLEKNFRYYDLYLDPAFSSDKTYTYEQAVEIVEKAISFMPERYRALRKDIELGAGNVDVMPNIGKEEGAFCISAYGAQSKILLNFMNDLDSVCTLAHEDGHRRQHMLTHAANGFLAKDLPFVLIEIPSIFQELSFISEILRTSNDPIEKLSMICNLLENMRLSTFRQMCFTEFEDWVCKEIEAGKNLEPQKCHEAYYNITKSYYDPNNDGTVIIPDSVKYEWMYVSHFWYRYYMYAYVVGNIVGMLVYDAFAKGKIDSEKIVEFYEQGTKLPPLESLKQFFGIDLMDKAPYESFAEMMNNFVDTAYNLKNEIATQIH